MGKTFDSNLLYSMFYVFLHIDNVWKSLYWLELSSPVPILKEDDDFCRSLDWLPTPQYYKITISKLLQEIVHKNVLENPDLKQPPNLPLIKGFSF